MSSRPPLTPGELRHSPRDRSPPRFIADRRPSSSYSGPLSARLTENGYRQSDSGLYPAPLREFPREPPTGPKAGPRGGGFPSRGRGFGGRIEPWNRETRDTPFQRRDGERDWPRRDPFDSRDRRPSPTGRNRSRSPMSRDSRDVRNPPPRDLDLARLRRDSRDGPLSASSSIPEAPQSAGFPGRGSSRGRGRGDLDFRGRGRGSIVNDRETFRVRSHSQERSNVRAFRDDRVRERDWDSGRRDGEEKHARDDMDNGPLRANLDTYRPGSQNSNGSHTRPSTPHSGGAQSYQNALDRHTSKTTVACSEVPRRPPSTSGADVFSREESRKNPSLLRKDALQNTYMPRTPSSPPQAPQVPAFGSVSYRSTTVASTPPSNVHLANLEMMPQGQPKATKPDPIMSAPTAPKALTASKPHQQTPTAPRATHNYIASTLIQGQDQNQDFHSSVQMDPSKTGIPSAPRSSNVQRIGVPNRFPPHGPAAQSIRNTEQRPPGYLQARPSYQEALPITAKPPSRPPARPEHVDITGKTPPRAHLGMLSFQSSPGGPPAGSRNYGSRNNTWVNPNINLNIPKTASKISQQPSIMNTLPPTVTQTVPAKRDYAGESRISGTRREQSPHAIGRQVHPLSLDNSKLGESQTHKETNDREFKFGIAPIPATSEQLLSQASHPPRSGSTIVDGKSEDVANLQGDQNTGSLKPESLTDDEEAMDYDEGEIEKGDKKFNQEMQALKALRPGTPRNRSNIISLLEELETLISAAEDLANGIVPEPVDSIQLDEAFPEKPMLGLPSPKSERDGNEELGFEKDKALQHLIDDEDENLPLEGLPFLVSGPPTPFSEVDMLQESSNHSEYVRSGIIAHIKSWKVDVTSEWERLREEYAQFYKPWKQRVDEMDRQKKAVSEVTCIATSPAPAVSPTVTPSPFMEVSRPRQFASEFELQRVIEVTKIAAEAEAFREKELQESQALSDMEKEAIIPDMLSSYERRHGMYEDTNHVIDCQKALEVLAFVPPQDNFTPEEHKSFTDLFMIHPKKWGYIAAAISGRNYQDCILHYYLSKKEANYKVQLSKKMTKKGRKVGKGLQARLKPNALMSDMGGRPHLYESNHFDPPQPPAVTETGRPKRTAAPTFGNPTAEGDSGGANFTPRRGAAAAKGDVLGESPVERPAARRTRTGPPKEKGGKRGKGAQIHQTILPAGPGPSPQKKEIEIVKDRNKEFKNEDEQHTRDIEEAQLLANLQKSQIVPAVIPQPGYTEDWPNNQPNSLCSIVPNAPVNHPPPPAQQQQQQSLQQLPQRNSQEDSYLNRQASSQPQPPKASSSQPTSSYWSVPEQNLFKELLAYFGTDWQQIANNLKTKTPVMVSRKSFIVPLENHESESITDDYTQQVKNYFYRCTEKGDDDLERIATEADEKIKNGVQMGSAPQPNVNPKRRHESVPQTTQQRPLAPNPEIQEGDESPALLSNASPHHSAYISQVPPRLAPLPQAGSGSPNLTSQSMSQKSGASSNRNPPAQQQHHSRNSRQSQGPPKGYFSGRPERESRQVTQVQPSPQRQQPAPPQDNPVQHSQQRPALEAQTFQEELTRQHRKRQEQEPQMMVHMSHSVPLQAQTASQPQVNENRPHLRTRVATSVPKEVDQRLQPNGQQPGSVNPSPPSIRRLDSFGSTPHTESLFPSTTNSRMILSPPQESIRAASVPMSAPSQLPPPSRPVQPKEAKRSNIMSILNDEPAEPQSRKSLNESRLTAPTPPLQPPAVSTPTFQQPSQLAQQVHRHDHVLESNPGQQHHHIPPQQQVHVQLQQRVPLNQQSQQAQHQQQEQRHQEQLIQPREPGNSWSTVAQRTMYEPRQSFTAQVASSPRQQHIYAQPASRPNLQHIQPTRAPSPPPSNIHPKAVSYPGMHPQQGQPQSIHQATPSLSASPYASMTQQPSQLQPHPQRQQPPPPQRPQSNFHSPLHHETVLRQQQQQQEATHRREEALHQQSIIRQQEFVNRHEYPRPKDPGIQQQIFQQQQEREREREREIERERYRPQDQLRRDDIRRNYTPPTPPPMYHAGYGGHPPPQQSAPGRFHEDGR